MGLFGKVGQVVSREVGYAAGTEHIKRGWSSIGYQWMRATKRVCPACGEGLLFPFEGIEDGRGKMFVGCNKCDHFQAKHINGDDESLQKLRAIAAERIRSMNPEEFFLRAKQYQVSSRVSYALSLLCFCAAVYFMVDGGAPLMVLNIAVIALFMFLQGGIASYRYWQAMEKHYFIPGSFKYWIGLGQWLV